MNVIKPVLSQNWEKYSFDFLHNRLILFKILLIRFVILIEVTMPSSFVTQVNNLFFISIAGNRAQAVEKITKNIYTPSISVR